MRGNSLHLHSLGSLASADSAAIAAKAVAGIQDSAPKSLEGVLSCSQFQPMLAEMWRVLNGHWT